MSENSIQPQLLDGEHLRSKIEAALEFDNQPIFLSAFFTQPAFHWIRRLTDNSKMKLAIRATPRDFLTGASDINAVRAALDASWDIRFISNLHAKVYLIGDAIFISSGNLTANGMALMGKGNLEFGTLLQATSETQKVVSDIFNQAELFSEELLDKMESFIANIPTETEEHTWWPPEVVPISNRDIFCIDFPLTEPYSTSQEMQEPWAELQALILRDDYIRAEKLIKTTVVYRWIKKTLSNKGENGSLHFGGLTKILHDDLADDPAPYRSTLKELLSNLLAFIELIPNVGIKITVPGRRSQLISLINN